MRLFKIVETVRASYWFVPSVMAFLAALLGAVVIWLDSGPASNLLSGLGWYQSSKPDGAREVLSTIAGSMITVAGVVFSITIVAIAYAASQYGPRVLTNFMSDRGNQVTLGTFIATFVYCLVVLRTIRSGDDGSFVPQLAVMIGLILAFCSIGVLIYFIHHVPQSIHLNNVVAHIGRQLIDAVEDRFPAFIGDPPDTEEEKEDNSWQALAAMLPDRSATPAAAVEAKTTGYIQAVSDDGLMETTCENDLLTYLNYRPGDYVHAGRILAYVSPEARLTDDVADSIRNSYSIGSKRTPFGDFNFLIDALVEIAARALSTGVNDPYTAISCIDWLGAGASEVAQRRMPSPRRVDKEGKVRVIALPDTFEEFIERAFGRMRQYVARDMNAALHMFRTIGEVAADCQLQAQVDVLSEEARQLVLLCGSELHRPALDEVEKRETALQQLLGAGVGHIRVRDANWLGGTAISRAAE